MSNYLWPHGLQHVRPPLSITNSQSLLKLMSTELEVMPSNHLILCHPLLLPPSIFPSVRVFSNESTLHIRWPKYWSFSFNIRPSNEYSGLISFRMDWLDGDNSNSQNATHSCLYCMFHWPCVWCSFCLEAYSLLCPLGQLSLKGLRLNM